MKSDEELIRSFHGGDREACDLLMERYKSMVRAKAKKLFLMGGDHDDLIQEGMIGLYQAINDFDETKETTFSSFAQLCVTRQMQTAIEAGNRKKNRPLNTYISIDDETIEHLLEPDPEERLLWEEDVRDRLKRAAELLSPMKKGHSLLPAGHELYRDRGISREISEVCGQCPDQDQTEAACLMFR